MRERRKNLGITAEKLAAAVGIDRTYISKIEREGILPSFEVYCSIEKVLKLKTIHRHLFLQQKHSEFSSLLNRGGKNILRNESLQAKALRSSLFEYVADEGQAEFRAFVIYLLNIYNPSRLKNKKLINTLVNLLKKLREKNIAYWKEYNIKEDVIVDLIQPVSTKATRKTSK